ncbi:MAG TPA: outer membrane protein assembly factor BamC [Casimicrobiaceae bacterium]|jgi:outer membrane protein assembly factor BamC|nr:outer membrane protein assembly factor BamC [Casimicrobiaceae bacterium]
MTTPFLRLHGVTLALIATALALSGCESMQLTKRIDYKSTASAPALELPPDLTTPRFDDRFTATTATGLAAQQAGGRAKSQEMLATVPDARIARAGNERWLVVKATPEQAWNLTRSFWSENGFVLATEQPALGVMETDWAENRAEIPADFLRRTMGQFADIFYTTYKRDKFRSRVERGAEPGTVEIYVSHRGMEQVPTGKIDNSSPAAFAWALMPPNPDLEAEMLTRLMVRFGTSEPQAMAAVAQSASQPERARVEKGNDGVPRLVVDETFDRAWRRVGLALDRSGFTVVDRDRSNGLYYVRYSDPDAQISKLDQGWLAKLMFWKKEEADKPEQYRIAVVEAAPSSLVTVQDPKGAPDKTPASDRILALLKDQLK